jgi:long-subunit acyl-CoA synthetase (AMP-forming)
LSTNPKKNRYKVPITFKEVPKPELKEPTEKQEKPPSKPQPKKDEYVPKSIEYLTYGQAQQKVNALGSAMVSLGLAPVNDEVP